MTKFSVNYHETYPFSDLSPQFSLAANTPLTYTVPGDSSMQYQASFSWPSNANVWVALNSTATSPTPGTMSPSTRCERNPDKRYVRGGDILSFISNAIVTDAGFRIISIGS